MHLESERKRFWIYKSRSQSTGKRKGQKGLFTWVRGLIFRNLILHLFSFVYVRKEVEPPQGYVQLLINKIVSNIRICCNNVILKYVEEDIVLSMNIKLLKFESANNKWESAYTGKDDNIQGSGWYKTIIEIIRIKTKKIVTVLVIFIHF